VAGFDFFRIPRSGYVPRTSAGALKALGTGAVPAEDFIYASTSAKPLDEEPIDLEAIERVLSRPDLTMETRLAMKAVLEKLIGSDDQEIALFGAEGINALEARHLSEIDRLRARAIDAEAISSLARYFYELAQLHEGTGPVRAFYLEEALATLRLAPPGSRISHADILLTIDTLLALGLYDEAASALDPDSAGDDPFMLILSARVAFRQGKFARVSELCRRLASSAAALGEEERGAVELWSGEAPRD
jgi:hypothetical protein